MTTTAVTSAVSYEDVINAIQKNIPTLPQILEELINRLSDIDSSLESIEDLIEVDQAITSRILKVSNKVEFLEPDEPRITSVHDALHKIGLEHAKRISLNVSVLHLMENVEFPRIFSFASLWQHSLGVAVASSVLAEETGYENPDQAYTCGLVHDIGKLIKIKFNQEEFCSEIKAAREGNLDLHDFELINECLKHDTLGSLMMEFWQMPVELSSVIRYHHMENRAMRVGVESADLHHLIDIVYLANLLVKKLQIGNSGHFVTKVPSPVLLESFGLDEDRLVEVEQKILENYEASSSFLATL
ncbi:MAG: HDOD domain-containing protein [Opitutae bacterium]|jgi:putative nucleotidyltransferase with HDIG domain|nr:HDOD domain-containing protein [Opitutae bacterium]